MNTNILSELSRTREIMGLRYKNYNLLTEQAKYIDDLIKLFIRRGVSREVAEMMANRVERLFVKTQRKNFGSVMERIAKPGNRTVTKGGHGRIISSQGNKYPTSALDYIIHGVTTGKITSKGSTVKPITNLQTLVNKMPQFLNDGLAFRKILLEEMEALEKLVLKETTEEAEKKAIKKIDGEVVEPITVDVMPNQINIPEDLLQASFLRSMWNFTKSIFYNPLIKGFGRTRQSAMRKFLKGEDIDTPAELQAFLTRLSEQSTIAGTSRFTPEEITKFVVRAIEKGEPIPPQVLDDMMGIFIRSSLGFPPVGTGKSFAEYLTSVALRRAAKKNGKAGITDTQLRMLIGDVNFSDQILGKLNELLTAPTLGGLIRKITPGVHWMPKSKLGKVLLWTSITAGSLYGLFLNAWIEITGSKKAIAGLTQQLYEKFSGQKEVIFDKGGLSDDEALAIATKLHGYMNTLSIVRDTAQLPEFEKKVKSYPHKDVKIKYGTENIGTEEEPKYEIISARAESIDDIPNKYRKEFTDWFTTKTKSTDDLLTWEANKFFKMSGVDDENIIAVIKMVPTVLAMSQVTWYYNHIDDGVLMTDLNLMHNPLPYLGMAWNEYGTTKKDVFDTVEKKEWIIGSRAAGDDLIDVVEALKDFWPQYPIKLKSSGEQTKSSNWTKGEWIYCRYKKGAYIDTDNLNRIGRVYPWDPIGNEENNFSPVDFQEYLNGLTAEEFNAGQCFDQGDGCKPPYFTPNKNHPGVHITAGEKIDTIVLAFQNLIDEMYAAWDEGQWEGLKTYVKDEMKAGEEEGNGGRNPSPNIQEGLIRVLK